MNVGDKTKFPPFNSVVALHVSFQIKSMLYKTDFYNSHYNEKSGQRSKCNLWATLREKKMWEAASDEVRLVKEKNSCVKK